jgi:hypothetical protein
MRKAQVWANKGGEEGTKQKPSQKEEAVDNDRSNKSASEPRNVQERLGAEPDPIELPARQPGVEGWAPCLPIPLVDAFFNGHGRLLARQLMGGPPGGESDAATGEGGSGNEVTAGQAVMLATVAGAFHQRKRRSPSTRREELTVGSLNLLGVDGAEAPGSPT